MNKYRAVLFCNNCHKERIVYIKTGIPIWLWLLFDAEECDNCKCMWFTASMFQ